MTRHDRALALFADWKATDPIFQAMLLEEEGWTSEEIETETGVVVQICYYRVGGDHCFCIADALLASCCTLRYGHRCPVHLGSSWAWRPVLALVTAAAATLGDDDCIRHRDAMDVISALDATGWCPRGMGRMSVPERYEE